MSCVTRHASCERFSLNGDEANMIILQALGNVSKVR